MCPSDSAPVFRFRTRGHTARGYMYACVCVCVCARAYVCVCVCVCVCIAYKAARQGATSGHDFQVQCELNLGPTRPRSLADPMHQYTWTRI